jgi:hypothetical protein
VDAAGAVLHGQGLGLADAENEADLDSSTTVHPQ